MNTCNSPQSLSDNAICFHLLSVSRHSVKALWGTYTNGQPCVTDESCIGSGLERVSYLGLSARPTYTLRGESNYE